ncbi:gliding motility-associated C-terminal domain-containing protein [Flavobacterium sp. FlaQc-57]|uniref:Ig-like domain-containing protein n=1 Tax=Flavobacterium sp. FlaQc-57 TaxID=3374186 RepID=UPI003756A665
MKKNFTFYDLIVKTRLFGLLFLLLLCNISFSQNFCRPTSHSIDTGGFLCVGMSVSTPEKAYDQDLNSYATISTVLGLGCFAEETLVFGQTVKAGDQIVLYLGDGNPLLSAGVLSNSSVQAMLSNNPVGDAVALNGLINIQLLGSTNIRVLKFTLPGDANQIKVQTKGTLSLLNNLRIYDVRLQFAKPTIVGGETQSVCIGQSATLSATAASGTTVAWYDSPTSTNALSTTATFTTPALNATTTYYVSTSRNVSCESDERLPVTINVIDPIKPTISSTGTSICAAGAMQATTLSVINPVLGTTYSWYSALTGGTLLGTGSIYIPTVSTGVSNFYVEASIGTCKSARTQVTVTSTPIPALATILTQSVSIVSGQNATLNASTSQTNVAIDWYDSLTGGVKLLGNSNTFTTPILTATTSTVTKTYYVETSSTVGGCVSTTRVPVTVTVLPNALGGCLEANSQQTAQDGICLLCSSTTPNNSVDGNSATAARLTLPAGLLGGSIQQTLQFNNPGKVGDIIDVELALPGGIADVSLLGGVSLATYNGTTYNGDRVFINNSLVNLQVLSGNRFRASIVAGANFDRIEIRFGAVVTLLTSLDIYQATYRYKAPTISGNTTICSGQTATLNANPALGETIKWYDAATAGNLISSLPTYTTPALTANTIYYVEITRNGCVNSERNPVTVTVTNPIAPAAVTASSSNICSGESTIITVGLPVSGTIYKWYDTATGGTSFFTGTSFTTPVLTANKDYYVEGVIGSCSSTTRTKVTVNVSPKPLMPIVTSSVVTIQAGQTAILEVSSPETDVAFDWYDAPTGGNLLLSNSSTYSRGPAETLKTYYIETRSTLSNCRSTTRAMINVVINSSVGSCLLANSQVTTLNGSTNLCSLITPLLCGTVTNPDFSVDGNSGTAARLSLPIGLLGNLQQMITFATPGKAEDIIDVELGVPVGLADISLLSSINLQSFNGVTANTDGFNIGNIANIQILGGNRFKVSFVAAGPFTSVQVRLNVGLAALFTSLDIYDASYRYPVTITGASSPICAGQSTVLTAVANGGQTVNWYAAPTGGTSLTSTFTTPVLNVTTPFYLEEVRDGCTTRREVLVTVLPIPKESDITITSPLTADCTGKVVLAPTSTLAGAKFKYYLDQNKTQEVTSVVTPGITYSQDAITGALTIEGLSASAVPYKYYISILNGACENANGTLKEVIVNHPLGSALTVTSNLTGCGSVNLRSAITNFDASGNTTYTFFQPINTPITEQAAANITTSQDYWIQAQTVGNACSSAKEKVTVAISPLPTLTGVTSSIVVTKGSPVTLNAVSNGAITWYDPQGNLVTSSNIGPLNTVGIFTYTVIATLGTCTTSQTVTISVIDPATCDTLLERVYADKQSWNSIITGTVTNGPLAVDKDPSTYSTITTGLGLLGIGTTWQNLEWPTTIPKGTPVTVKLGLDNSLIAVGQSISVVGTKRDGSNNPIDIGTLQSVSGSLLNLLPGQNSFEYTFVPSNTSGVQGYDGIRVQLGSILSVAQNIKVYDAYYEKQVSQIVCGQGDIEDIFSGVKDLGVGALTATVGVSNPWNVADGDVATYATMFNAVGVLAAAELTAKFRTPSMVGDSLRITISKPGTVLNVNLLTGFIIQLYSGNIAVGDPIESTSNLLTLKLLSGDTMAMTIVSPQAQPYDKVVITFGGVLSVLDQLRVHTIDRVTNTKVIDSDLNNKITVCPGTAIKLTVPPKSCADYAWYDTPIGGTPLTSGQSYALPATLAAGTYKYYIQPIRYGCPALSRGEVTVVVRATTPASAIARVTINGGNSTIICSEDGKVTLDAVLNATPVLTTPIYSWYSFDGTTSNLVVGETTSKLSLSGLAPGTYTYFVGVSSTEYCETAPADRKQVTFTILPSSLETDITVNNALICLGTTATLTPKSTLANPVFFWYFDENKTQPLLSSTIAGVTYAVDNTTGVLTVSGLKATATPLSYYVAVTSDNTCQNKNGELKVATVIVSDPATPTSTAYNQSFCLVNKPTVANLQVNEANVVWYTLSAGGTALDPTTSLANGIYYGAIKDVNGCESSVRSIVTVTVTDPLKPTTLDDTQDFCLVNNPKVSDLKTNETNVVWYNSLVSVTPLDPITALANGTYYATLKDATTGCESSNRLLVTVTITDPLKPTTLDDTQDFCLVNNPKVSDLKTNETNVVWYNSLVSVTPLDPTTLLANGTYYATLKDAITGCESSNRLLVTVNITDPGTPTLVTAGTQTFCLVNAPTFASVQFNQTNIVWYTALTGGTLIPSATALTSGVYFAAIKDATSGCESNTRLQVTIDVKNPVTPTLVNAGTQNFCLANAPTFASVKFNETNIVWYTALTGGTLIPTTTVLTDGVYFAAIKDATSGCESNTRLQVTIKVNNPGTPTLVTAGTQNFCLVNAPTFASIKTNEANIVWYTALTGGTLIATTTALTSGVYFAAIKDPVSGCESNTRLQVTINVTDPGTPTLVTAGTQTFCLVNAPTFASVQFNQANIVWYTTLTGGTLIPSATVLTSGVYFAAIKDATSGCESNTRLQVTINVTDPGTPTLVTAGTQNFCVVNAPIFASVKFNQSNIVWYTALTGGVLIPSTTTLTNGVYFAAIKDPTSGCESAARLQVTISITDPATPTTNALTQVFCSGNNPTVANIQTNQSNVVWYSAATGGTAIAPTSALVSGDYFAALKDATTGCESSIRLKVTITVGNTINPTTNNATQNFCSTNAPTFASIQVNQTNVSWFNSASGGTAIPLTTPLTSGTYYGDIVDPLTGCASTTRLQVAVTIVNPMPTPTTNAATQNFCSLNAPKVLNIQVNEQNVIWYSTPTGGTAIPGTTDLTTATYYGVIASGTGCENPVRLMVVVKVNAPGSITTPKTTQTFCLSAAPTIANILVNETNVLWYSSATGGTPLAVNTPLVAATYYAGAVNNTTNGCDRATRLGVTVSFEDDALVPITTTDDTPCVFQGITYSVANGKSNYVWSITNGTITSGGGNADGSVTVSWSDIGQGKVQVTYINTCNDTTTKSLNVTVATCSDITITNTVSNPTPNFGDQVTFTITVNNVGQGNFINTVVSELIPSGYDLISASTSAGTYDQTTQLWSIPTLNAGQSVTLTVVVEVLQTGDYLNVATIEISTPIDVDAANNSASASVEPICLTVYNEFTPNNDGANDLFRIDCIESYPNNELKIYNRYGALVYSKQHYENDWNGTANVSGVINRGDMLPTGTYFYVIAIGDGTVKKGWVSIMR